MSRTKKLILVLSVVFMLWAWTGPAGADSDGYIDNFAGDLTFGASHWDPVHGAYVPDFSETEPGGIRAKFDSEWGALRGTFCTGLEAAIRHNDSGWQKTNHCTPTPSSEAELRAKSLGPDVFGFRYVVPGLGKSIYAYDSEHYGVTQNVDISFDVTIDVSIRVAPGLGVQDDDAASTPLSLQSARLSFSKASVTASACDSSCAAGERTLDGTVMDISGQFDLSGINDVLRSQLDPRWQYGGLAASLSPTAAQLEFSRDTIPAFDSREPVTSLAWSSPFGSVHAVFAVDRSGLLDDQTSYANGPYGHWFTLGKPAGTAIASWPAGVVGSDLARHVFVRTGNGHLYEMFDGRSWIDRGRPPGTTATGTPVAAISGALPRVVTRGANGHIELLSEAASGTWSWLDLGSPGTGTFFRPQLIDAPPYTAVAAVAKTGHLVVREARGASWLPWRDLGVFPVSPSSDPSSIFNGASVTTYVTGIDHRIEQASFAPFGTASFGPIRPYRSRTLPRVSSPPAAAFTASGDPTIFAVDTTGSVVQLVWTRQPHLGLFSGFISQSYGTLLATTMRVPAISLAFGTVSAFVTASNQHVAETEFAGSRPGLIDHTAVSRVEYQAHSLGSTSWLPVVQEGQSSVALTSSFDQVRVQSTEGGSVLCQADAGRLGWRPEVNDGQPCGVPGETINSLRFRLADAAPGLHVLYRCLSLAGWTPWVGDGTACSSPDLKPITGIQLAYSDAAISDVSYRAHSQKLGWQSWTDEGMSSGTQGATLDGIEVHSNIGGNLRCQPYLHVLGWANPVDQDALCGDVDSSVLFTPSLEAFTLTLDGGPPGEHVQYRSFIAGVWLPWVQDGQVSGQPGLGQSIQQVQIQFVHTP
jgi:hypothetical protein